MKAIIFIDMQEDFSDYGPFTNIGVLEIDQKIPGFFKKISKDTNKWKVIFSMDYHPRNHISFKLFPMHCIKGTLGVRFLPNADSVKKDLIVKKGTHKWIDNLSAVYNGKRKTKLEKFLKQNEITKVYLAGVIGDICVKQTYLDLVKLDYNPLIIDELTYFREEDSKEGLNIIKMEEALK